MRFFHYLITRYLPGLFVLICILPANGQEQLRPLNSNQVIQTYLLQHPRALARMAAINDTLSLPFIDDFSRPGIYPFDSLWTDSDAFINSTFCDRPPSIGVATLDGIDKYGRPHDSTATIDGISDHLTSRPLNLGGSLTDTSIWFNFFYQPQGLGDEPEDGDSLVLEFRDSLQNWNHIWAVNGHSDTVFQRVNIHITNTIYLYSGFQFRFYNIATNNGNRDHWNIDYVTLARNSSNNPDILDITFMNPLKSQLNEYQSMPWSHYKSLLPTPPVNTVFNDSLRIINYNTTSYNYHIDAFDEAGNVYLTHTEFVNSQSTLSDSLRTATLPAFNFPVNSNDSANFVIKDYIEFISSTNPHNDTNYFHQHFYNYYSYDDGSAEYVSGVTGNTDVKIAYMFDVKMRDTLRGLQIYWNPGGLNIHTKLFQLAYWSSVSVSGNSDNLVYKMINQRPANIDSINGFATYLFDTMLVVGPGPIWVGFIQNEPQTFYGIGFDRNIDSRTKMYYHFDGFWYQSNFYGSWMMRPLFGDTILKVPGVGIQELGNPKLNFSLYPNPVHERFNLVFESLPGAHYTFSVMDILGKELMSAEAFPDRPINTSRLSAGLYFIRLTENRTGRSSTLKFIIP